MKGEFLEKSQRGVGIMRRCIRPSFLLTSAMFASVAAGSAASIQTVVIDTYCNYPVSSVVCSAHIPGGTSGVTGHADFTPIGQPWTFDLTTGAAVTACTIGPSDPHACGIYLYYATYDSGEFTMTGPAGLTFTGVVTSGFAAALGPPQAEVGVSYFGQWSDGLYGYGTAMIVADFPASFVHLDSNIAPEPSPLMLFGTWAIVFCMLPKRFRHQVMTAIAPPRPL